MHFVVVQSLSCGQVFATSWTAACQASLSFIISQSLPKFMSISDAIQPSHSLPPSSLPSIFHSIRVFSNEPDLHIRWPMYWSFSTSPSNEYLGLISLRIGWFDLLLSKGLSRIFSSTTVRKYQFFGTQPSLWPNSHTHT